MTSLDRIRRSYQQMAPRMGALTQRFYDRLFTAWPQTRQLFRTDLEIQRRHLAAALALIVRNLDAFDALEEPLRELGRDHAHAGVRPEHYPVVADAMLAAMAEVVGDCWNEQVARDWRELLSLVSLHMLAGSVHSPA